MFRSFCTIIVQRSAKIKAPLANSGASDDRLCAFYLLINNKISQNWHAHLPTDQSKGKNSHSGFVFFADVNICCLEFSSRQCFIASMACARKQMTVEDKNDILSMH